ncbi:hypothetical protein AAIR98_000659 [Elusimicrobium simillimum]|uniref:hypothetical protein n=1 Tax=Elusimicrobium simillimum TaxID=3143438 RepID=UPI003C6F8BE1
MIDVDNLKILPILESAGTTNALALAQILFILNFVLRVGIAKAISQQKKYKINKICANPLGRDSFLVTFNFFIPYIALAMLVIKKLKITQKI